MLRFGFVQSIWLRWSAWHDRRRDVEVSEEAEPSRREFASKREQMEEKASRARELALEREAHEQEESEPATLLAV